MEIIDYFKEISMIPRGSTNEKEISDYIVSQAKKNHYEYVQDSLGNVVVYVPATSGYEDHDTLMLQGHLDMVCEKNSDTEFNFERDPLQLYEEDGWLHAKGTTLGADDGYAVAYMLTIMNSDVAHPALECVFTVQEEIGLVGVKELKASYFKAKKLIGMDSGGEEVVSVSSSGGRRFKITKKMDSTLVKLNTYTLKLTGMSGGHSGGNINKQKANAIQLTFKILNYILRDENEIYLIDANGGLKENAIARECKVTFCSDASVKYLESLINEIFDEYKILYEVSDPNIRYELRQTARKDHEVEVYTLESSKEMIKLISLLPYGTRHISMSIPGLVIASDNIGVVTLENGECIVSLSIRSPIKGCRDEICDEIIDLCEAFNANYLAYNDYPGWNYEADSPFRKQYAKLIEKRLNKQLVERATHGGLELGVIKGLLPDIDIITLGPKCSGAHTPEEKMNIASFKMMYEILVELLADC